MSISIIAAIGNNFELGYAGNIPWNIPDDLKRFKNLTLYHPVIMGRITFESILVRLGHPLVDRTSLVISNNPNYQVPKGCILVSSFEQALAQIPPEAETFAIGGARVYKDALIYASRMYLTHVQGTFQADTYFPRFNTLDWKIKEVHNNSFRERESIRSTFVVYERTT